MLRGFLKPFDGFTRKDYETYTPDKWSSNLHNLARMEVKQKLEAMGAAIAPRLSEAGLELDRETSSERPSIWNQRQVNAQWLYFFRDARAQRELAALLDRERSLRDNVTDPAHHHNHMVMGVRVDAEGVSIVCGAHAGAWLDRRNMARKWADPHERAKCVALLGSLGSSYAVVADGRRRSCAGLDASTLDEPLAQAHELGQWLCVEHRYGVDDDAPRTPAFVDRAAEVLETLAPVYRFFAWSKDNDYASMAEKVVAEKKARRKHRNLPFEENDEVEIVGGLFAGQRGYVQGFDGSGKVKVKVGTLTLPVSAGSLKRVSG